MAIYSLCRVAFYFFNRDLFGEISLSRFFMILGGGIQFDIAALLYLNIILILLQIVPFSFRFSSNYQRISKWLFIITNSLGLLVNFIDFVYYRFTLKRTTATVFSQFSNEQNKLKLGLDFLKDYWYLLVIYVALIWILIKLYDLIEIKKQQFKWSILLKDTLLMLLFIGLTIVGVRGGWRHSTRPITLSNAGEFVEDPAETSIVLNTPFSILRTLRVSPLQAKQYYHQEELNKIYTPIHQPHTKGEFKNLNVVFLIIESLGKEHIGGLNKDLLNGQYRGYTPFIDSLINQSLTFNYTLANGRKSIDALPSVISSIPSIDEPFVLSIYSNNKTAGLPKILKEKGYETAFFHGAPNGSMGFSAYTKQAGIDHYFGKTEYNNDTDFDGMWGIWDEPFMQYMANTINTFKQPFFSAFFSTSSHHPFKVPENYIGKFPKGPLQVQECLGYTDLAIRKFFETAAKMPWYKNTLFVLCADHATVSHLPEYQNTVGYYSVPILFYLPGGNLKGKKDKIMQQTDIMPTVLNFLNYDKPYFAFGFDALDNSDENFAVNNNEGNFRFYWKDYLMINDGNKTSAIYKFKTDRLLKNNLEGQLAVQPEMEKRLKAFIQQYNNRMINNQLTLKP
ncbi:MAG: LTA synthase family protein [Sphingobacteriaceae bacterium]